MRRGGGGITDSGGNLALGSVPIEEEVRGRGAVCKGSLTF